ncbi:MAG: hypothetical protein FWH44_02145 [Methanomassiliicoccaceae archaeon]|nr:hypothetical protein [Methanomassiliicoccaceae archaeon]
MAKKRRRESAEPEDTYEFTPPEFDEREFLLKDMYGTKVLLVVVALAIIIGILAACLDKATDLWYLGLLLLILAMVALRQFMILLKFRVDLMDQKSMISNYILFLMLSLGVWIIILNPPFS